MPIKTPISALWAKVATLYSSSNPPTASTLTINAFNISGMENPHTSLSTPDTLTILTSTAPVDVEDTAFNSPIDGLIIRVANGNDPETGSPITLNTLTGSPPETTIAVIAQGEIVSLFYWADVANTGDNARWIKIPGIVPVETADPTP